MYILRVKQPYCDKTRGNDKEAEEEEKEIETDANQRGHEPIAWQTCTLRVKKVRDVPNKFARHFPRCGRFR